jgi:hypothetical protein
MLSYIRVGEFQNDGSLGTGEKNKELILPSVDRNAEEPRTTIPW